VNGCATIAIKDIHPCSGIDEAFDQLLRSLVLERQMQGGALQPVLCVDSASTLKQRDYEPRPVLSPRSQM
jgi:hypothetical protein